MDRIWNPCDLLLSLTLDVKAKELQHKFGHPCTQMDYKRNAQVAVAGLASQVVRALPAKSQFEQKVFCLALQGK